MFDDYERYKAYQREQIQNIVDSQLDGKKTLVNYTAELHTFLHCNYPSVWDDFNKFIVNKSPPVI